MRIQSLSLGLGVAAIILLKPSFANEPKPPRLGISGYLGTGYSLESNIDNLVLLKPRSGSAAAEFLEAGGVIYSENAMSLGMNTSWQITDRLSLGVLVPTGYVQSPASETLPGLVDEKFALGDIVAGAKYTVLEAAENTPNLVVGLAYDFGTSDALSLGDGFTAVLANVELSYRFSDHYRFLAHAGYELTQESKGTDRGNSFSLGIGLGVLYGEKQNELDVKVIYTSSEDAKLASGRTLELGDGASLLIGNQSANSPFRTRMYIAGIDDFDIKALNAGISISYRFLPK